MPDSEYKYLTVSIITSECEYCSGQYMRNFHGLASELYIAFLVMLTYQQLWVSRNQWTHCAEFSHYQDDFFYFSGSILAIPWVHKQCILQFCGRKDSPLDLVDTCVSKSTMYMDMLLNIFLSIIQLCSYILIHHKSLSIIYISIILYFNF